MLNRTQREVILATIAKFTDAKTGDLTIPKKEIARRLMAEHSGMFLTLDNTVWKVRYYTGATGKNNRMITEKTRPNTTKLSTIEEGLKKAGIYGTDNPLKHVKLPAGKYLVLSDIHIPFQHDQALAIALHHGAENNITGIVLNGDIMDCYDLSRFSKELNRPSIGEELEMTRNFLKYLTQLFPGAKIWFKEGNHEERMRHYILRNARELGKLQEVSLEYLLGFKDLGIVHVKREIIKAGKLNIMHGHEMGESVFSPVNPARGTFLKTKASVLHGHNHQRSTHRENTLNEDPIVVHSTGCLCHMTPEYRPYAYMKWCHGAALVEVHKGGRFNVENFEINKGEIYL